VPNAAPNQPNKTDVVQGVSEKSQKRRKVIILIIASLLIAAAVALGVIYGTKEKTPKQIYVTDEPLPAPTNQTLTETTPEPTEPASTIPPTSDRFNLV
jgi:cell division protein FtsN